MKYRNHVLNNKCRPRDYLLLSSRIGKKKVKKEINKIKIKIKIKKNVQIPKIKKNQNSTVIESNHSPIATVTITIIDQCKKK